MGTEAKITISAYDKTGRAFRNVDKKLKGIDDAAMKLSKIALPIAGFLALTKVVGGLAAAFTNASKELDQLNKTAERMGTTIQKVKGLQVAAGLSGVNSDILLKSIEKLGRKQADAVRSPSTGVGAMFQQLGLDPTTGRADAAGNLILKDPMRMFMEASDAIKDLPIAEKTAALLILFEETGTQLSNYINLGSKGQREQMVFGELLGEALAGSAEAATENQDELLKLKEAWHTLTLVILSELTPAITMFASALTEAIVALGFGKVLKAEQISARIGDSTNIDELEAGVAQLKTLRAAQEMDRPSMWNVLTPGTAIKLTVHREKMQALDAAIDRLEDKIYEVLSTPRVVEIVEEAGVPVDWTKTPFVGPTGPLKEFATNFPSNNPMDITNAQPFGFLPEADSGKSQELMRESIAEWQNMEFGIMAAQGALQAFSDVYANAIADWVINGGTAADLFETAWKSAIAGIMAELVKLLAMYAVLNILSFATGGGSVPFSKFITSQVGTPDLSDLTAEIPQTSGAPETNILVEYKSLTPGSTADAVRAGIEIQNAVLEEGRFSRA